LKKHLFLILLILFFSAGVYLGAQQPETDNLEVYIDIPLHLDIDPSPTEIDLGYLPESGTSVEINLNIRANKKPWTLSAKATYASLTWGAKIGGTWIAPGTGNTISTLVQIIYKVSLVDKSSSEVLFPMASLSANIDKLLYTFNRKTTGGDGGEDFTFTVDLPPMSGTDDWESGKYQDTIMFTITAP